MCPNREELKVSLEEVEERCNLETALHYIKNRIQHAQNKNDFVKSFDLIFEQHK